MVFALALSAPFNLGGPAVALGPGVYFAGTVSGVTLTAGDRVVFNMNVASLSVSSSVSADVDPASGYCETNDLIPGIGQAHGGETVTLVAFYYAYGVIGPPQSVTVPGPWVYSPDAWQWQRMNDLNNSMRDVLDALSAGIGSGPALSSLKLSTSSPSALSNPFTGTGALVIAGGPATPAGLQWQIDSFPPGAGDELGALPVFQERVLQLVAYYQLGDASYVPDISENQHEAQGISLFDRGVPDHIDYWISPGFGVNFWWLIPV